MHRTLGSSEGNQWGEMAVPVTELKSLDTPGAGRHRLIEHVGFGRGKSRFAVLPPHTVQRLESRR
jgi:hypothetical protein